MGLKQRFDIVLIGMMKAVEGLAVLGLMCAALSLSADAQAVVATVAAGTNPQAVAVNPARTRSTSRTTTTVTRTVTGNRDSDRRGHEQHDDRRRWTQS